MRFMNEQQADPSMLFATTATTQGEKLETLLRGTSNTDGASPMITARLVENMG